MCSDTTYSYVIPIAPVPRAEPRFAPRKKWQPTRYNRYKKQVRQYLAWDIMRGCEAITGPISLSVVFVLARKGKNPPALPSTRNYGDFDNFLKGFNDCGNGILFKDDSQIVALHFPCEKRFPYDGEEPHTEFEIKLLK